MSESEIIQSPPRRLPGRPLGSRNKSLLTEVRLLQHAKARSFCTKAVAGGRIKAAAMTGGKVREWCFPTVKERLKAAEILLRGADMVEAIANGVPIGPAAIVNIQIITAEPQAVRLVNAGQV